MAAFLYFVWQADQQDHKTIASITDTPFGPLLQVMEDGNSNLIGPSGAEALRNYQYRGSDLSLTYK